MYFKTFPSKKLQFAYGVHTAKNKATGTKTKSLMVSAISQN